jgi:GntR family transcriptional regulator
MGPPMSTISAETYRLRRAALAALQQTSPRRAHDLVRAAIRSGELRPGDRLEEVTLVRELATSRNAVREALQMLADEGLVTRAPREGTTVVGSVLELPLDDLIPSTDSADVAIHRLNDRRVPSTALIRDRLQTSATEVGVIEQLFTFRGEPIGVWIDYYDADIVQPESWAVCPDLRTAFEHIYGTPLGWVETTIEARPCEPRTMRLLGLNERIPMLVKEHVMYDVDGVPHDLSYSHYRADRVSFTVKSRTNVAGSADHRVA